MSTRQVLHERFRTRRWRTAAAGWLLPLLAATSLAALSPGAAAAQPRAKFVFIDQDDDDTWQADQRLHAALQSKLRVSLTMVPVEYHEAVPRLSLPSTVDDEGYLARVTPYVYVAAEMLGADLEIIGTYLSEATKGTTYRAYFVVNRAALESVVKIAEGETPDLGQLLAFLRARSSARHPAHFVYHNKFSTSSYFLPALYFRHNGVFSMLPRQDSSLSAIRSEWLTDTSSTQLVEKVAAGAADFAAVWDGTKFKFEQPQRAADAKRVYFIPLPTALPNDLLVCSRSLLEARDGQASTAKGLRELFLNAGGGAAPVRIEHGDFREWMALDAGAQEALAGLRVLAREQRVPVTVRIDRADGVPASYVKAARLALRLSGTELVPHEEAFHKRVDYVWTLRRVREGYVTLTSRLDGFGVEQTFPISFKPTADGGEEQDLAQRIGGILASRLHRIRYVWPYDAQKPQVIRDVPFSLAAGADVAVQRITWTDPQHNGYTGGVESRRVPVEDVDLFTFRLAAKDFAAAMADERGAITLDPMSPVVYRVLLPRDEEPQAMFAVFNVAFLLLLGLSVVGTVLALWRARRLGAAPGPAVAARALATPGTAIAAG